jgi:hypothetical protein
VVARFTCNQGVVDAYASVDREGGGGHYFSVGGKKSVEDIAGEMVSVFESRGVGIDKTSMSRESG